MIGFAPHTRRLLSAAVIRRLPSVAVILLLSLAAAHPASAQERPRVTPEEYGRFESLLQPSIAPDGGWLAYRVRRVDETEELRIRPLAGDTLLVVPWGGAAEFSADSRWAAWSIGMSEDERERLREEEKPIHNRAGLRDLQSGVEREFASVRALSFDPSGRFLALHGYSPEDAQGRGADLRIVDLRSGTEMSFGNVSEVAWSDRGGLLALVIATGNEDGNAVHLYRANEGVLRVLDHSTSSYRRLAWRDDAADLAVLRSAGAMGADSTGHSVLAWRDLEQGPGARLELAPTPSDVPDTLQIVGHAGPRWTEDGRRIAVGLRPIPPGAAESDSAESSEAPELPGMQLWHTRDVRLIPQQKNLLAAQARRTLLAVWEPESGRVVQVASDLEATAGLTWDGQFGVERISAAYDWGTMFGRPYHDVWVTSTETGERTRAAERVRYSWESPDGRYLLTFDGTDYHAVELATGRGANLTEGLAGSFANQEYDTPTDLLPPHGTGGWMAGDASVLLYDRYDVWAVSPDGSGGRRLTNGADDSLIHRVIRLDPAARAFDPDASIYLSLRGEWTENRGYARLSEGRVERLVLRDRMVAGLLKADSAEVFLYREEGRDLSPNLLAGGPDLHDARQVTATNPFLADFAWTRAELLDFESEAGERLQGVLLYPVNHDPSRTYPMIVYTYEMLSPQMHSFQVPSERSYYNFSVWTQEEYFVLLPDIRYRARDPGVSAIEALRPAIGGVVERGLVDRESVGLIGHSWGGYQAAYLPTRTDLFAASVAGAPLTDFVSFMGQIHWGPGAPEVDHWETGQGRMEVPFWEDPEAHYRNSPLHAVHEMETPLLMAFGDDDGVVEWWQGTVFYNFARRAEKQMVLLVYEGEGHGFQREPNQVDYHRRILEWFGHYLKGDPAPAWITDGIPFAEFEAEAKRVAEGG